METILTDKQNQKTWSIQQIGNRVITASNGGKAKEKVFEEPEQAAKHVQKETWSRLKKGLVLNNPKAGAGRPVLHRYIGGGYTGSMPLAPVNGTNTFYCSYVVNQFEKEEIYLIDEQGEIRSTYELPGERMIYELSYCPAKNELLMNRDHQIAGLCVSNGEIREYTAHMKIPASTLSLSGTLAVWHDHPNLVVYDLETNVVRYTRKVNCELYGGHSPQLCAAVSHDGSLLSFCEQSGEVVFVDLAMGLERTIAKAKSAMTAGMAFSPDGRFLFMQEEYGSWALECYVLESLTSREKWKTGEIKSYAIQENGSLIAVYNNGKVQLYDIETMKRTFSFEVEHVVKNCNLAFTKDYLAVYTDYGCVSLYALR